MPSSPCAVHSPCPARSPCAQVAVLAPFSALSAVVLIALICGRWAGVHSLLVRLACPACWFGLACPARRRICLMCGHACLADLSDASWSRCPVACPHLFAHATPARSVVAQNAAAVIQAGPKLLASIFLLHAGELTGWGNRSAMCLLSPLRGAHACY